MKENRTNKALTSSFKSRNPRIGGYTANHIKIDKNTFKTSLNNETKIRHELQTVIIELVKQRKTIEEIKQSLNKEEYKSYEQYFDLWIENWVIKSNTSISKLITKRINENKNIDEIIEEIQILDSQIYNLYKQYIINNIQTRIQEKMRKEEKNIQNKKMEDR